MESLQQYVLAVVSVCMLCGVVLLFFHNEANEAVVKLVTGLMVTLTVVSPLLKNPDLSFINFWEQIAADGTDAVIEGERQAQKASSVYIKESLESYISNKARELGTELSVDIKLKDDKLTTPEEVTLTGKITPYLKERLSAAIESEIGISEDKQIWIIRN